MLNFKTLFLIVIILMPIKSQLRNCKSSGEFQRDHEFHVKDFDLRTFLQKDLPTKSDLPYNYLGKGSFGKVYKYKLVTKNLKNTISSALKVIRYQEKSLPIVNTEVLIHQKLSKKYPLEILGYFSCVYSKSTRTVITFNELMSYSLDDMDNYVDPIFKKYPINIRLGQLLLMARSIQVFNSLGFAHLDIKPANFMALVGSYPIIKAIDYGMVTPINQSFFGGTELFMDPAIFKQDIKHYKEIYKVNTKSDVYSLGLTFQFLSYDKSSINMVKDCVKNYETMKECSRVREQVIRTTHKIMENKLKNSPSLGHIQRLNMIIQDMIRTDPAKRKDINNIVDRLTEFLRLIEPDSIYLPENKESLQDLIYGDNINKNTPLIKDIDRDEYIKQKRQQKIEQERLRNRTEFVEAKKRTGLLEPIDNKLINNANMMVEPLNKRNKLVIQNKSDIRVDQPLALLPKNIEKQPDENNQIMNANEVNESRFIDEDNLIDDSDFVSPFYDNKEQAKITVIPFDQKQRVDALEIQPVRRKKRLIIIDQGQDKEQIKDKQTVLPALKKDKIDNKQILKQYGINHVVSNDEKIKQNLNIINKYEQKEKIHKNDINELSKLYLIKNKEFNQIDKANNKFMYKRNAYKTRLTKADLENSFD